MRQYHRWISIVAAMFLLVVSATGVILQVQKLTGNDTDAAEHGDKDRGEAALTTAMPSPAYAALVSRTLDAARTRIPNSPVASITLKGEGDEIQGIVTLPGDPPRLLTIDARSGRILSDVRQDPDSLIKRIHSGAILGEPGVVLGILWGLALVILSLTGGWVYISMYRRRRKASGKAGVFWR
jgi:uncharacterized iron-regulated membrane protein